MKIYYAHCMLIYNTLQEKRDIEFLERRGFQIFNPNREDVQKECQAIKNFDDTFKKEWRDGVFQSIRYKSEITGGEYNKGDVMSFFNDLVKSCDVFAFRPMPNGQIPAGVFKELKTAYNNNIPIIELPSDYLECYNHNKREMSYEDTVVWLKELGQR